MMNIKRKVSNCEACERPDSYDNMVCCDHCDTWYHYICAGVSRKINLLKWVCPICLEMFTVNVSEEQFSKAVQNCFDPTANWQLIKCQILESKFKTYASAKAAEDSILRNLTQTKNVHPIKRCRHVDKESQEAVSLEADAIEQLIEQKVALAIAKHFEDQSTVDFDVNVTTVVNVETKQYSEAEAHAETNLATVLDIQAAKDTEAVVNTACNVGTVRSVEYEKDIEAEVDTETDAKADADKNAAKESVDNVAKGNVGIDDSYLPVELDEMLDLLENSLESSLEHFLGKCRNRGAETLPVTMRLVGNQIVNDKLLQTYSFLGRGDNKDFSKYENIKNLICRATVDAYNNFNDKDITLQEAEFYFRTSYVRLAKQRYQRSLQKK